MVYGVDRPAGRLASHPRSIGHAQRDRRPSEPSPCGLLVVSVEVDFHGRDRTPQLARRRRLHIHVRSPGRRNLRCPLGLREDRSGAPREAGRGLEVDECHVPVDLTVDFSDTRVRDEHLALLDGLAVGGLTLDGTRITDSGRAHLVGLPGLELLSSARTKSPTRACVIWRA